MNTQEHSSISSEPHDNKSTRAPTPNDSPKIQLDPDIEQNPGVARVEALHRHLSGPWRWMLYLSIAALAYVYSLDQNTTSNYLPYATSSFGKHSFIGTIGTAEGIITAVGKPCIAKIADLASRPFAYIVVLIFYVIGYILPLWIQARDIAIKMDLFGLVLIGFIFGLILFPISLAKTVSRGWANPSIIAMIVVGVVLIPVFIVWERFFAPIAIMPRRIITNRAFLCAVGIDFFYNFSGFLRSLYLSSFVWVVKDWNTRQWVYFNNTMTVTLCVFGLVGGLILRYTRRYKFLQISGLCIRILGLGLMVAANGAIAPTVQLVWTQILIGIGGAFSVVGSRVGSQASVPHEDLASVIALLSLWSSLGTSVGSATATAIWTSNMPDNLVKYLPGVPAATINKLYGSIKTARDAAPEIRAGVIQAYSVTTRPMFISALGLSFISLILAFFMPNFFLGDTHNAVDGKNVAGERALDATVGTSSTPINQRAATESELVR
ncbi:hypothetical protein FRC07_005303 [Ceratobasidium sp. 392]|nr:hypothetical protein FRC07_005303 [Ceratobasidium sp. 392]